MSERHYVIPIFVPHSGCPHQCIFCNQKSISGAQKQVTASDVSSIIIRYLDTFPENAFIEAAFYGGSFTGIELEKQTELLKAAYDFLLAGNIQGIRLSTRPDYISREILCMLKHFGVSTIELGVQSMDSEVLSRSCRGHTPLDVIRASRLIKEFDFMLGHQMMIGLPGDTLEKDIMTAKQIIELEPDMVRIYPVLVVKDTPLEQMYKKRNYAPLNVKEAVELSKQILKLFKKNGINVIRLGLQVTENINYGKDVIAGPLHPAFRELVESELRLEMITYMLSRVDIIRGTKLDIKVNNKEVSITVGHKRGNLERLYADYEFNEITVTGDSNLDKGKVVINIANQNLTLNEHTFLNNTKKLEQI